MKKVFIAFALFCIASNLFADNTPAITIRISDSSAQKTHFSITGPSSVKVDWGDGIKATKSTSSKIEGILKGTKVIKIYGENISILNCQYDSENNENSKIASLDISNCTTLTELYCSRNELTALDISKCTKLKKINCFDNLLTSLDASKCTGLTLLECDANRLTSLNISGCTEIVELRCSGNELTSLDLSSATKLTLLGCFQNQLTTLDVSNCTALATFYCFYNKLTSLDISNCTELNKLYCNNNRFSLATLPQRGGQIFYDTYAPQAPLAIAAILKTGTPLDLSAQNNLKGATDTEQTTSYVWQDETGKVLTKGTDYTEVDGVFTFLKAQAKPVYCTMATAAFPKFTGDKSFKTTLITVEGTQGIANTNSEDARLFAQEGVLTIEGVQTGDAIAIYTVTGQQVKTEVATDAVVRFSLSKGYYLVKVASKTYKVAVK